MIRVGLCPPIVIDNDSKSARMVIMIDHRILTLQNPWWQRQEAIAEDSKIREYQESPLKYEPSQVFEFPLEDGDVNLLFGPRQTGKSTALKLFIQKLLKSGVPAQHIFYFSCDALGARHDLIDVVLGFLDLPSHKERKGPWYLFLDEVSSVSDWPYAIKWLVDAGLLQDCRMVLSGSSSVSLKKSGEFMPGRRKNGKDIHFLPISFFSYLILKHPDAMPAQKTASFEELKGLARQFEIQGLRVRSLLSEFFLSGGFLIAINANFKHQPLASVAELYVSALKSELAKDGKKELHARAVLKKILASLGSETSYANVAEEADLGSKNTGAEYLRFFSDSFLMKETLFYSIPEARILLKKNKKYYPSDPLLFWVFNSFVTGSVDIEQMYREYQSPLYQSQLAESYVASELGKSGLETYFFKGKHELDFYLPRLELGIEVKCKDKITSQDLESVSPARRKVIVSNDTLEQRGDVWIIPVHLFGLVDWNSVDKW